MSAHVGELTTRDSGPVEIAAPVQMSAEDLAALREAVRTLERSTLAGRLSGMAGRPLEILGQALPAAVSQTVSRAAEAALKVALRVALTTLPRDGRSGGRRFNTVLAATSGAVGGALGLATLPLELPLSTTLMLRAIAEIARDEGENLEDPEAALACLQVFALGGRTPSDDLAQSGYFAVRSALAKSVSEAARLLTQRGLMDEGAPALVRLAAQIASRFGMVVSQKVAAGAVPVIGAIGGAAVNAAFMEHFQAIGRAHFVVRRLERAYGREPVRRAYEEIRAVEDSRAAA
jgi:hypothetical protein